MDDLYDYYPEDTDGDGWVIDDVTGVNPIDDTREAIEDALPDVPDLNPLSWLDEKLTKLGDAVQDNIPLMGSLAQQAGLSAAVLGGLTMVCGTVATVVIVKQLGSGRNAGKLIDLGSIKGQLGLR